MVIFNKLIDTPLSSSREMRAYMQAILEVTGLMAGERFDISRFMQNYRTHLQNGRLLIHEDGSFSLSNEGREYFISRLTDEPVVKGQNVTRPEVIEMIRHICAESPAGGWTSI